MSFFTNTKGQKIPITPRTGKIVLPKTSFADLKKRPDFYNEQGYHIMKPKEFLDLASSTGLEEGMHNSGIISDVGGVHSDDPNHPLSYSVNWQAGGDEIPKAKYYWRKFKKLTDEEKRKNYEHIPIKDSPNNPHHHPFRTAKDEKSLAYNTTNKILGTGKDTRQPDHQAREYPIKIVNGKPIVHERDNQTQMEIFRGDELGSIEYLKRKLRSGEGVGTPRFDVDESGKITGHEGRHRSRAMMEEGITEIPVAIYKSHGNNDKSDIAQGSLKGQEGSLKSLGAIESLTFPDTRYPISKNKKTTISGKIK